MLMEIFDNKTPFDDDNLCYAEYKLIESKFSQEYENSYSYEIQKLLGELLKNFCGGITETEKRQDYKNFGYFKENKGYNNIVELSNNSYDKIPVNNTSKRKTEILNLLYDKLKKISPEKHDLLKSELNNAFVIKKLKDKYNFRNRKLDVQDISLYPLHNEITLKTKYCECTKQNHENNDEKQTKIVIDKYGNACYICMVCFGKKQKSMIHMLCPQKYLEHIFTHTNNAYIMNESTPNLTTNISCLINNTIIINNNSNVTNKDTMEKILIQSMIQKKYFKNSQINNLIMNSLQYDDVDNDNIKYFCYHCVNNNFKYYPNKGWYYFNNNKWHLFDTIDWFFTKNIFKYYEELKEFVDKDELITDENKNIIVSKIVSIEGKFIFNIYKRELIIKNIISSIDKNNIEMDKLNNLICFSNGIYDIDSCILKNENKDDMISMSTNYNFPTEYINKNLLLEFFGEILSDIEIRKYFIAYIASLLFSKNDESFLLLKGDEKSRNKIIKLIMHTFGEYCEEVDYSCFESEQNFEKFAKKRIILCKNFNGNQTIDIEIIKKLFDNPNYNFSVIFSNNEILQFKNNEYKYMIRAIDFERTNIKINYDEMKNDFMLRLLKYYKIYKEHNLIVPESLIGYKYEDSDIYSTFLKDCTEKSTKNISAEFVYKVFELWMEHTNLQCKYKIEDRFTVITILSKIEGVKVSRGIIVEFGAKKQGFSKLDINDKYKTLMRVKGKTW